MTTRGLHRNHWTLILTGTPTIGTQAAIESVSDKDFLEDLLGELKTASGADMKPFQALLRVQVANDVPLQTHVVTARHTE